MSYSDDNQLHFGYVLLRETLIPELLGNEEADILYWGGKRIARLYPADNTDDIIQFFEKAGWGELQPGNEKKKERLFEMSLLTSEKAIDRHMEAGFLAEQIERQTGRTAETFIIEKRKRIIFEVHWD